MLKWLRKAFSVRGGACPQLCRISLQQHNPFQEFSCHKQIANLLQNSFLASLICKMNVSIHTACTANAKLMHIPSVSLSSFNKRLKLPHLPQGNTEKMGDSTFISQNLNPLMDSLVSSVSTFISLRLGLFSWEVD